MITFSQFQSLGEEEKLKLLLNYMDTYQPDEIAAHWHKSTQQIFDLHLDLIRKNENQGEEFGKSNMLSYEEIKELPPKSRAELVLAYHQILDGKTGLLAERIGIEVKKAYNLIYQSRQKLAELKERQVNGMTVNESHNNYEAYNEEGIDQLQLEMNLIDNDMTVTLSGEGNGGKIATLLKSIATAIGDTGGMMSVELKIKRPD